MGFLKKLFRARREQTPTLHCALILVAAGSSSRMGGEDKILHLLDGVPVLIHSLRPFETSELVREIVIVTRREQIGQVGQLCKTYGISKVTRVVLGGDSRMESVRLGLAEVSQAAGLVAIHDGARPFVTGEIIDEVIRRAETCSAAAPAIPVKDTIKEAKFGVVTQTLPRENLFAVQTPQVFEPSLLKGALGKAMQDGVQLTDDCSAVERLGFSVVLTPGSEENIKLTTPEDFALAEAILERRAFL